MQRITEYKTLEALRRMNWRETACGHLLDRQAFHHAMELVGGIFYYQGAPRADCPHPLLVGGTHSRGYLDVGRLLKSVESMRMLIAQQIVSLFDEEEFLGATWVIGSATSGDTLAAAVAEIYGMRHGKLEKTPNGGQTWSHKNMEPIVAGELIIQVEDLVKEGLSASNARAAVRLAHPGVNLKFAPRIATIVKYHSPAKHRSGVIDGAELRDMFPYDIETYDVPNGETCPYCIAGSPALSPKENRELFFGQTPA